MDSGNEYVVQVKGNQKSLCEGIQQTIKNQKPTARLVTKEKNRGRQEMRKFSLYKNDGNYLSSEWKNLHSVIEVINTGKRKGTRYREIHYYISSLHPKQIDDLAKGIRNHWLIENRLHWVKDVIQHEDGSRIEEKRIAINLSLIKSIAISLFRINGYNSVKRGVEKFKNRVSHCGELIGITSI